MQLIFIYGQVASGKLTVGKELGARSGLALFHNHLVVDAVAAVFPFGTEQFARLRERFWLDVMQEAARTGTSLIFTFAPEPTVDPGFPERAAGLVAEAGGSTLFVALEVTQEVQEQRLTSAERNTFGKMTSVELLRSLRGDFERCFAAMPKPDLRVDTTRSEPAATAQSILSLMAAQVRARP
jgi:hypothetical protein